MQGADPIPKVFREQVYSPILREYRKNPPKMAAGGSSPLRTFTRRFLCVFRLNVDIFWGTTGGPSTERFSHVARIEGSLSKGPMWELAHIFVTRSFTKNGLSLGWRRLDWGGPQYQHVLLVWFGSDGCVRNWRKELRLGRQSPMNSSASSSGMSSVSPSPGLSSETSIEELDCVDPELGGMIWPPPPLLSRFFFIFLRQLWGNRTSAVGFFLWFGSTLIFSGFPGGGGWFRS